MSNIASAADIYATDDGDYMLKRVEKTKNKKYAEAYSKTAGAHFLPFVMATGGRLGG